MPYGYLGTTPNQQLNNSGVFSVEEALALQNVGELGGSLEHIQTQTISSGSTMAFTSIKESRYDTHFIQGTNIESSSASVAIRLSNDGGSSYEAGTSYQLGLQYMTTAASSGNVASTGTSYMEFVSDNNNRCGYAYLHNLGNSSLYSYSSYQQMAAGVMSFGGGCYKVAETINAIQVLTTNGNAWTGTVSLYGVKDL